MMPPTLLLVAPMLLSVWVVATGPVRAQVPADSALTVSAPGVRGLTIRLSGGLAGLALGDAAAFHEAVADAYVASGVPVPTQRSFAPGPHAGLDVLWTTSRRQGFGLGLRYASTSAYSLYGDYAGTLDIVSTVSAVFLESVSVVELRPDGRICPFLGSRGGTVFASSTTREALDLGEGGSARAVTGGRGAGYSLEGFGGATVAAGPVGLFVQAGYRYARVGRLSGEIRVDDMTVEEGQLPYALNLSGWTGVVGLTVRRR